MVTGAMSEKQFLKLQNNSHVTNDAPKESSDKLRRMGSFLDSKRGSSNGLWKSAHWFSK